MYHLFLREKLIIDTKFYSKTLETNEFGDKTINPSNLRQINAYLDNASAGENQKVDGMLLHPTGDMDYDEVFTYRGKFKVYFQTINLNQNWKKIRKNYYKSSSLLGKHKRVWFERKSSYRTIRVL